MRPTRWNQRSSSVKKSGAMWRRVSVKATPTRATRSDSRRICSFSEGEKWGKKCDEVANVPVDGDAAAAEGVDEVGGPGAEVDDERIVAREAPHDFFVDARAAAVPIEPLQVAQRALDVLGRRIVFVEELRCVETSHC